MREKSRGNNAYNDEMSTHFLSLRTPLGVMESKGIAVFINENMGAWANFITELGVKVGFGEQFGISLDGPFKKDCWEKGIFWKLF